MSARTTTPLSLTKGDGVSISGKRVIPKWRLTNSSTCNGGIPSKPGRRQKDTITFWFDQSSADSTSETSSTTKSTTFVYISTMEHGIEAGGLPPPSIPSIPYYVGESSYFSVYKKNNYFLFNEDGHELASKPILGYYHHAIWLHLKRQDQL